jgi:SNF2 family DNA or RNA helicase
MAEIAIRMDGSAFLAGVGSGKTRAALEAIQHLITDGQLRHILVVAPKRVLKVWEEQSARFTPVLNVTRIPRGKKQRTAFIAEIDRAEPGIFLVNYDVLHDVVELLRDHADLHAGWGVVLDELHRVKNPRARRTKATLTIARLVSWRLGMTGTAILQGGQDIWSQWYFVDLGLEFGANYVQFRREFLVEDPYTLAIEPQDGSLDEIAQRLLLRSIRVRTEDCIDLPTEHWIDRKVTLTPEQQRAYAQMEDELLSELDDPENPATAAIQIVSLLRLTQITSGFVTREDGTDFEFPENPKLEATMELIEDIVEDGKSVLVWALYKADLARLRAACAARHIETVEISGRRESEPDAEERFQSGSVKVLIGQPGAGGSGLNLQQAAYAIYYSYNHNLEHRQQSAGRNMRGGSIDLHDRITYYNMVAENTIDEQVLYSLAGKTDTQTYILDLRRRILERILRPAA